MYCLLQLHLLWIYHRNKKKPGQQADLESEWPKVSIQLPIFNEKYVVQRLIESVCAIDYPRKKLQIQVLDDSTDETLEITRQTVNTFQEKGFDIEILHRKNRSGYKAGALKAALPKAKGEFIAIFDADFIPDAQFLYKTLPHFSSSQIGVVQTRWGHINEGYSLLTRLQAFQLNVHFCVEQTGRDIGGYFLQFNGTAGVWRKSTILDAGNWQSDTLTEDLDLSYRCQLKGWKITYLEQVKSPAELPAEMNGLKSQQYRWMKGGAETAKKILPQLWKSNNSIAKKIHGSVHLLSSSIFIFVFLVALLSVPLMWYMELRSISPKFLSVFFVGTISIIFVYYSANVVQRGTSSGGAPTSLWKFIGLFPLFLSLSMGLSMHNSIAVWDGLRGKRTPFIRTPKYNITTKKDGFAKGFYLSGDLPLSTKLEIILALVFLSASYYGWKEDYYAFLIFHLLLTLGFASIAFYSINHMKKNERRS
jgi:cellulose synthase/poly-beta-1,6-N-acetylglucosamine synthase-like glycosyltransferase